MSRATTVRLVLGVMFVALLWPAAALAQLPALNWQSVNAPYTPGASAIAAGFGADPEPDSPMFLCRAEVNGSVTPGKWVKGDCNVPFGGREIVTREYELAYGDASWQPFGNRNDRGLIQTGHEADGTPLYSCRVRYWSMGKDLGYQPGKIVADGECHISYGGREISMGYPFEALYTGSFGSAAILRPVRPGVGRPQGKPLCKSGDSFVMLQGRTWAGPNCIPVDVMTGQPVYGQPRPAAEGGRQVAVPPLPKQSRELCRKGDPDVELTAQGYAGPNCITSNEYGEVAHYGNATPEERARLVPCEPGDDGVHVQNGMLVGIDCKSVPEPKAEKSTLNQAATDEQAARKEAEVEQAKAEQARAEREQAEHDKVAAQQKAAEEKAAADERAAREADELRQAKEDQAKAEQEKAAKELADAKAADAAKKAQEEAAKEAADKAAKEQADREKAEQLKKAFEEQAAAQKAAAEQKAAKEKEDREKAEQLKKAFEEQAAADKAAKEKEDREKIEQLKKAFEEQAEKNKQSPPASSSGPV